ncbi:hypothetical protein PsorP6_010885 [Peronosclerospora sorghi]|uniref:Uncharacterized protein n=1 Tax=Peronosclerospora sorghi TaxID=230839 RepID=A0ACC0VVS7_9STRA|nr:hypothetical protein PsorP6_010885 [Peronosclerospora sorghi]
MRFVPPLLATVAVASSGTSTQLEFSRAFGGPYGTPFSDEETAKKGYQIISFSLNGKERLDGVTMSYTSQTSIHHGGHGGEEHTLDISMGVWYTNEHHGKTRVFYLKLTTNMNRSLEAGETSGYYGEEYAPYKYQLAGFRGNDGDEIDLLQLIWAPLP